MEICYISDRKTFPLPEHRWQHVSLRDAPSLTPVVRETACKAILLDQRGGLTYSMPHILSAARIAYSRGRALIVLGPVPPRQPYLLVASEDGLGNLLTRLEGGIPEAEEKTAPSQPTVQAHSPLRTIRPLPEIRKVRKIPLITVAGSQRRIGCTTQSIQLYHYCRALGFMPALIAAREDIQTLSSVMDSKKHGGTVFVEGIPCVTDCQAPFDCYVADLGVLCQENLKTFRDGDLQVLVAGVKPWELSATVSAIHWLQEGAMRVLILAFCARDSFRQLQPELRPLAGNGTVILAGGWHPQPFQAGQLEYLDLALRDTLLQICSPDQHKNK